MIKRLHSRRSHGTLVANPRHKRRNGAKRGHKRSRAKRGLRSLFANPRRKKHSNPRRKHRNPSLNVLQRNARRRRTHRNPGMGLGIDLMSVGVGSVAAIALGSVGQAIFNRYLSTSITNPQLAKAAPSLLVAAGAFAANKYMKNAKIKSIAKVTMALSIFKAIDDSFGQQIEEGVTKMLPKASAGSFGGAYVPALRGLTSGAYIDSTTGGAYMHTSGVLPGAGLYGL